MRKIGKELWRRIERNQGYAYISDGVRDMNDEAVIEIVEVALMCARRVVRILERFLAKYRIHRL